MTLDGVHVPRLPAHRSDVLRVAAWNCRRAVARKWAAVDALDADVVVIPEAQLDAVRGSGRAMVFKGASPSLGLAVIAGEPYTLSVSQVDPGLPWLLPVDVWRDGELVVTVLAVWTVKHAGDGRPSYTGQLQEALSSWSSAAQRFGRDPWTRVVVAGDVNASFQGPSADKHATSVQMLTDAGLVSVHHAQTGEEHGQEQSFTLRWIGPGKVPSHFHCDYVWISVDLQPHLASGGVGTIGDWVESGLSDHTPVWADLKMTPEGRRS